MERSGFRSTELMNLPNILTILRVVSVPFFIWLLLREDFVSRVIAFALFVFASVTDLIDGYLARKWKQETELGKFLDPLADKMLVLGAFITFLGMSSQVELWMVLCIVGRDMLITVMRWLAIREGKSLRTSVFGKIKTSFQMFAIITILLSFTLITYKQRGAINAMYAAATEQGIPTFQVALQNMRTFLAGGFEGGLYYGLATFLPYYLMVFTTIVTLISGLRYIFTNYRLFTSFPVYLRGRRQKPTDTKAS